MSNFTRILIVENGLTVFIRDSNGNQVGFNNLDEAKRITGHDFTGKFYIGYEPDVKFFADSTDQTVTPSLIPFQPYESLIDNISLWLSRVDDEYYGLDASTKKNLAYNNMVRDIRARKSKENLDNFLYNGKTFISDQDSIQATQNDALTQDGQEKIRTFFGTPTEGSWLTANSEFVAFTASEFIAFAQAYFMRGSNNFTTYAGHVSNITSIFEDASKTAEDILTYDFSGGWH